jgi:hypothetical protein
MIQQSTSSTLLPYNMKSTGNAEIVYLILIVNGNTGIKVGVAIGWSKGLKYSAHL